MLNRYCYGFNSLPQYRVMKSKILMLTLATGIVAASCSSSKQTSTGSDTATTGVTDTSTVGTRNIDTMRAPKSDTMRTDTAGRSGTTTPPKP